MSNDDKISEIHEMVIEIRESVRADRAICDQTHKAVDEKVAALHRVVKGNGKKGLEDKHNDLHEEFVTFKASVLAYASIGSVIGGFAFRAIAKSMGWQ